MRCAESRNNSSPPLLYPGGIVRVSILKEFLALLLLLIGSIAVAQQSQPVVMPPVDRAKLPPNLRNLPLHRLSSGALMLLNRDNNLVLPPRSEEHTSELQSH